MLAIAGKIKTSSNLGRAGVKKVVIVPVSFVTDHIETLYELDQLLKGVAAAAGISCYRRSRGLNTHPVFVECLVDLAQSQTDFWKD